MFDQGELLVLPPALAHDIRNIPELSHGDFMKEVSNREGCFLGKRKNMY